MKIIRKTIAPSLLLLMLVLCGTVNAGERIAILSFELNDITSLPNTQTERVRTASIKTLLEQDMNRVGDYDIIQISPDQQQAENAGFGYLFRFHDVAAKLGKTYGADWIIVGQHSKPSFLYSYLMAHVINVKTGRLVARYDVELKGNHQKVTQRGVRKLSREINKVIIKLGKGG
ncbi:MAG: DUF2380 domain-containing protein [Methylococcales bacterium]|nr:DUF2380 domain-containing protein [Methylococcales bacterium]